MHGNICRDREADITALMDGELTGDEAAVLQGHLHGCAPCSALAADLAAVRRTLRVWDAETPATVVSPGFRARVLAAARSGDGAPAPVASRASTPAPVPVAVPRRPRHGVTGPHRSTASAGSPWGRPFVLAAAAAALATVGALSLTVPGGEGFSSGQPATETAVAPTGAAAGDVDALLDRYEAARLRGDDGTARGALLSAWRASAFDPRVRGRCREVFGFDPLSLERDPLAPVAPAPAMAPATAATDPVPPEFRVGTFRFDGPESYAVFLEARERSRHLELMAANRAAADAGARSEVVTAAVDRPTPPDTGPLARALASLEPAGEPVTVEGLTVYPLRRTEGAAAVPTMGLEEALESRRITVREDLRRRNDGVVLVTHGGREGAPVLLQAGDLLQGGRMDRMVARDVLVAPGTRDLPVPVVPVEFGRRSGGATGTRFERSPGMAGAGLRGVMLAQAGTGPLGEALRHTLDGLQVTALHRSLADAWSEKGPASPALRRTRGQVETLARALEASGATAFAVSRGDALVAVEIYGSPRGLAAGAARVLRGCALEGHIAGSSGDAPSVEAMMALLHGAAAARAFVAADGLGAGIECGLVAPGGTLLASGVTEGGILVHGSVLTAAAATAVGARDLRGDRTAPDTGSDPEVPGAGTGTTGVDGGTGTGPDDGSTAPGPSAPRPGPSPTER